MSEFTLPNDPMILLSVINTKLRDFYPSLDALCDDLGCDSDKITTVLGSIDYSYSRELNKFI